METVFPNAPTVVTRRHDRSPVSVPSLVEQSSTAGLAVAPCIRRDWETGQWYFTGEWQVVHTDSGYPVAQLIGASLGHARETARLLARGGTDWTYPLEILRHDPLALDTVASLREQMTEAISEHRPVLLHVTSWRHTPPQWLVDVVDANGEFIQGFCCRTYAQAEDTVLEIGDLWAEDEDFDVTVSRPDTPFWELHCSRHGCSEIYPLTSPEREELADVADVDGWRRIDVRRWLCPTCSSLFRSVTN